LRLGSLSINSCRRYSVTQLTIKDNGKDGGVIVGGFSQTSKEMLNTPVKAQVVLNPSGLSLSKQYERKVQFKLTASKSTDSLQVWIPGL
jgi:hypothetical protein